MSSNINFVNDASNGGFLSGFVEASVEKPADGLNGECTVHYSGQYSKYEMIVSLVNGVREGEAIILNDGIPFLNLEYERGLLTGTVEKMNDHGIVVLRGHLVNGVESGLFLEYENEKVVWIGYYQNGQRHMEVRNRIVKQDGSGEFYELDENGKVTQLCLYVQGLKHRVIARFNDDVMTEFDENEKRTYEGEYTGSVENGFMREGTGKEYAKGGKTVEYFGDWKNGKRNGIGTEYRGLRVLYIGEWKDGMKDGKGYERDENGVVRSVCWVDGDIEELKIGDKGYNDGSVTELKLRRLVRLKRVVIGDDCFGSARVFELDELNALESVTIGTWSFTYARTDDDYGTKSNRSDSCCRIGNCPKLRSIRLGYRSFSDYHSFELCNLPSLQSLEIGDDCFFSATLFSLSGRRRWLCEWQIFRVFSRSSWEVKCSSMFIR